MAHIFGRQNGCVECQSGPPACPVCDPGKECQISVPLDCTQCPKAFCGVSASSGQSSSSNGPSTGAIAGGVVGGLALIGLVIGITYMVWRNCIKNKRQKVDQHPWEDEQAAMARVQREKAFADRRDQRASTHTVNSIASTVLTRASNIIQIAYIPGVTNRAQHSPGMMVPPVPPIPMAVGGSNASSPVATDDQHFFMPGNLRDSTYSGISAFTDRTSYAPRSSIASGMYGKTGVVVTPAQTGKLGKAAMVSVKSSASSVTGSDGGLAPPVPAIPYGRYRDHPPASPAGSTFSVGSTFLKDASAQTATATRAQVVQVVGGGSSLKKSASTSSNDSSPAHSTSGAWHSGNRQASTAIPEEAVDEGPFSDPQSGQSSPSIQSTRTLSAVIEEATKRASQRRSNVALKGPFSDEHAAHSPPL